MIKFVNNTELLRDAINPKALSNMLDTIFNETVRNTGGVSVYKPSADIIEKENQYEIRLALPGYTKTDISLELIDSRLTVSNKENKTANPENIATENQKNADCYLVKEIYNSNFSRTFKLPENVDKSNIGAEFRDGILYISINKTDPKAGITVIEVK